MRTLIMERLGRARFGGRSRSENGMVQYRASRFPGHGRGRDDAGSIVRLVSIAIDQRPGYVIDLTKPDGTGAVIRPPAPASSPALVIDGTAVELGDDGDGPAA